MVGSPPRVRGTDGATWQCTSQHRITPACAGNSIVIGGMDFCLWDHPRVCGEQSLIFPYISSGLGSPPRVRGTGAIDSIKRQSIGITPACAGNSLSNLPVFRSTPDHPRVCGEQTKKSPSFLHSFLSDQENSFSLKYNCSISSQSFCARWTSLQGSSKCFAKVDS